MQLLTYCDLKALDLSPVGSMTTSSSAFPGLPLRNTTNDGRFGTRTSQREVGTKMAGGFGLEVGRLRMALWRNWTKIVPFHAGISPAFLPNPQMIHYTCTTSMTLTHSPENSGFLGKPQRTSLLLVPSCTSVLYGISKWESSHWERPRRVSIIERWKNGLPSWYTHLRKWRHSTANSCTHAWSFPWGEPTSQSWRGCWQSSITVLSYHALV